eukprot:SM000076S21783  [mRNA]  locus=s76:227833:230451:+ [translate_table: standard]
MSSRRRRRRRRRRPALEAVFAETRFDAVIHFAGLKAVGESVAQPLLYYRTNVVGTLNLVELMAQYGCKQVIPSATQILPQPLQVAVEHRAAQLVFSSSATVYGQPDRVPCTEDFPLQAVNPYGRTKLFIEHILQDVHAADPTWRIALLRYFNPVGAHPSGLLGEDPVGIPNNLMPFVQQVAVGRRAELTVYGSDYPTRDGTGVRDYIHVMDLADGHTAALSKLLSTPDIACVVYNLGTGSGTTVLEMVSAFEKASGQRIPLRIAARRPGDAVEVYASTMKAEQKLGWKAKLGMEMCRDQWKWASSNPNGYQTAPQCLATSTVI